MKGRSPDVLGINILKNSYGGILPHLFRLKILAVFLNFICKKYAQFCFRLKNNGFTLGLICVFFKKVFACFVQVPTKPHLVDSLHRIFLIYDYTDFI